MAFPKVNAGSFWTYAVGGLIWLTSFFVPGGAAKSGWYSYPALSAFADTGPGHNPVFRGETLWIIGFILIITSSMLGSVNFITTIIQLRARGLTFVGLSPDTLPQRRSSSGNMCCPELPQALAWTITKDAPFVGTLQNLETKSFTTL
jgi:hypothetical protein